MLHAQALSLAVSLVDKFHPYCDRIAIGGSVRRGKADVHDIEIVAIPRGEQITAGLFGETTTVYPLQGFLHDGEKSGDWRKIKGGQKYVQLALPAGINVDLFLVTPPAQWGVIFALRTGPADFNHWAVTPRRQGGGMPGNASMKDGQVFVNGIPVTMPEETDFLNFLGLDWIDPMDRQPRWGKAPVLQSAVSL